MAKTKRANKEAKIRALVSAIQYEEAPGIHTYHICTFCNKKRYTRAGKCSACLAKELADLLEGRKCHSFKKEDKRKIYIVRELISTHIEHEIRAINKEEAKEKHINKTLTMQSDEYREELSLHATTIGWDIEEG